MPCCQGRWGCPSVVAEASAPPVASVLLEGDHPSQRGLVLDQGRKDHQGVADVVGKVGEGPVEGGRPDAAALQLHSQPSDDGGRLASQLPD